MKIPLTAQYETLRGLAKDVSREVMNVVKAFHVEHKPDNTHGAITADSINVDGGGVIASLLTGTYTPTLTNTTNIAASTAYECRYFQLGSIVHVAGRVDIDPTAAGSIVLGMSIPVASNFSAGYQASGVAAAPASSVSQALAVFSDSTNDRVTFQGVVVDTADTGFHFTFTYRVI